MRNIEIHCTNESGEEFILNRLTGDNAEAHSPEKRQSLMQRAKKMAYDWTLVFPYYKIKVVEV